MQQLLLTGAHFFYWLTLIQLYTQVISLAIIQIVKGSNWVVEALRIGLGLTGDNSPKKKHIADDRWISFLYYAIAYMHSIHPYFTALLAQNDVAALYTLLGSALLMVLVCGVFKWTGVFILFKFYDGGRGFGFNLYYWGWRKIGLDWHAFQVRQDLKTGKPLKPEEQYFMNRPHIDLPDYNLHHWPWAQTQSHEEMTQIKESKADMRKAREEAKAQKRARREKVLAERQAASDLGDVTPTASNMPSPMLGADFVSSDDQELPEEVTKGLFD